MHIGLISRGDVAYALDLAHDLHGAGHRVSLYLPYAHVVREVGCTDRPAERLCELGLVPYECKIRLIRLPRMRDPRSANVFYRLRQSIRRDGVDVAHVLAGPAEVWLAVLACLLVDIPVVSTMIVPKPNVGGSVPGWVKWAIQKLLTYGSDIIITNGLHQVELVQKLYRISPERVAYVPLNVRTMRGTWMAGEVREEPGAILFFGRAEPHKGLEYLVRTQPTVTRQIPHARFLISGHGSEIERCRCMLPDPSRFEVTEGYVSGAEMARLFQRASVVVLPYLSASTSGVLMTAYCYGKPVVATSVGALPEYVEDEITGLLVPPACVEELARAIIQLLSDEDMRSRMSRNISRWVAKRRESVALETLQVYDHASRVHRG